jgi:O-antigen/teichoic acid export membrane protein
MLSVNLASFPLVVRALEQKGIESAVSQLKSNFILLTGIAIPGTVGLILVSKEISQIFLGQEFSITAASLIPLVALGIMLAGLKSFYFDQSFQLGERTLVQLWPVLVAAVLNIFLNLWWIPVFGILGSAYSTIVSYAAGLLLSIVMGRRVFKLPFPFEEFIKIIFSGLIMGLVIYSINTGNVVWDFVLKILTGITIYSACLIFLNVGEIRIHLKKVMKLLYGYRIKTN